jgi:hypothetical protein
MRLSTLLFAFLLLLGGCAAVGNSDIKSATIENMQGQTRAQLIQRYGSPTMRTVTLKDGVSQETLVWSYAFATLGYIESTAISVTFDAAGHVVSVTQR